MSGEDRTIECDGCGEAFTADAAPSYLREIEHGGELLTVCRHRARCEVLTVAVALASPRRIRVPGGEG